MIEPMAGAKFEMRWNGVDWDVMIERFVLKDIQGMDQLGQEFSALVLKAFEDDRARQLERFEAVAEPIIGLGPLPKLPKKFKGNK